MMIFSALLCMSRYRLQFSDLSIWGELGARVAQAAVVGYRAMRGEWGLLARLGVKTIKSLGWGDDLYKEQCDDVYQGLYHLHNEWCQGLCWIGQYRRCGFCPIVQCPVAGEKHGPRPPSLCNAGIIVHHFAPSQLKHRLQQTQQNWLEVTKHPQWIIWGYHLYDWLFILIVIIINLMLKLRRNMMNSFIMLKGLIMQN